MAHHAINVNREAKTGRGNSWSIIKNENPNGSEPYSSAMSHPNVAKELFIRKRNLEKEGKISPTAFNKNIRPSKRLDDQMTTPTLNRL